LNVFVFFENENSPSRPSLFFRGIALRVSSMWKYMHRLCHIFHSNLAWYIIRAKILNYDYCFSKNYIEYSSGSLLVIISMNHQKCTANTLTKIMRQFLRERNFSQNENIFVKMGELFFFSQFSHDVCQCRESSQG